MDLNLRNYAKALKNIEIVENVTCAQSVYLLQNRDGPNQGFNLALPEIGIEKIGLVIIAHLLYV